MPIFQMCNIFVRIHELGQMQLYTSVPFLGTFLLPQWCCLVIVFVGVVDPMFAITYRTGNTWVVLILYQVFLSNKTQFEWRLLEESFQTKTLSIIHADFLLGFKEL